MLRSPVHPHLRKKQNILFAIGVLLYFGISIYRSLHHVMWEDEWFLWLRAHAQHSIVNALYSARYDGLPPGWYLLLYGLTRLTANPVAMKVLHVTIATATVCVIWRWGRFSILEKLLIPFGYFFFFEYSTITRPYAAGIFFGVIAAACFSSRRRNLVAFSIFLVLMSLWSIYSLLVSLALALALLVELRRTKSPARTLAPVLLAVVLSAFLFYFTTRPPEDARMNRFLNSSVYRHPTVAGAAIFDAYFPLPPLQLHWWNHFLLPASPLVKTLIMLALSGIFLIKLRTASARVLFGVGIIAIAATILFVYTGFVRHWGHAFILLLLAIWIDRKTDVRPAFARDKLFLLVLIVQLIAGISASVLDLVYPFSAAPRAAEFIRSNAADLPIAGDFDYALTPLIGELNRPIWMIRSSRYDWSVRYDMSRKINVTHAMIDNQVRDLARREGKDALLVMTYLVPQPPEFELIATIPAGTVEQEGYFIYRYHCGAPQ